MNKFDKILMWLSGKKSVIASIILTTVGYLGSIGKIDENTVIYIGGLVAIIFGTASAMTKELYQKYYLRNPCHFWKTVQQ